MIPDFAGKLARVITEYSTRVKEGDFVISGTPAATPLIEALYLAVLEKGAHPVLQLGLPGLGELMVSRGNDAQLQYMNPLDRTMQEQADVILSIEAPTNME
jgi:aminopeptidase